VKKKKKNENNQNKKKKKEYKDGKMKMVNTMKEKKQQ